MLISILFILSFIIEILLILGAIWISFTPYYFYNILILGLFCITFLLNNAFFRFSTKRALITKDENYYKFYKLFNNKTDEIVVYMSKKDWQMHIGKNIIHFRFNVYLFKKSFIRAYVYRNLIYEDIHLKKPVNNLFKHKFYLGKEKNVNLIFIYKSKRKIINICSDGVVKNSFLSKEITKTHFANYFLNKYAHHYLKTSFYINEEIFDRFVEKND